MLPRKENGQPIPLQEYYQKGFFTKREFFNSTLSFRDYFISRGVSIPNRDLAQVTQILGEERGMLRLKYRTKNTRVRIDADVLDQNLPFLKQTIKEVSNSHFPERSADEIVQARDQILRSGDGNGGLIKITFDQAYQLLFDYGVKFFETNRHPGDAEAHTQDLIIKILPYLNGEKGHFWHIHHFRTRFFKRALVNMHNDIHNKQMQDQRRLASTIVQPPPSREKGSPIDPRSDLSKLTTDEVELVEVINKGLNYRKAADLFGVSDEVIKKRVQRIRKKLKDQSN